MPADIPDPASCIFRHVSRTSRAVALVYDAALAPVGLTAGQFDLLMTLHLAGPKSVGELAKLAGMDASTVPRVVRPLIERALVTVRSGQDRRLRIVSLTAGGQRILARAAPVWAEAQRTIIKKYGRENWRGTMAALAHLRTVLRDHDRGSKKP